MGSDSRIIVKELTFLGNFEIFLFPNLMLNIRNFAKFLFPNPFLRFDFTTININFLQIPLFIFHISIYLFITFGGPEPTIGASK